MIAASESVGIGRAVLEARFLGRLTQPLKHRYAYTRTYRYTRYTHEPGKLCLSFSLREEDQLSNCLEISILV